MKGDFTRFTFDRRKHYSGIRMQQGRVQLDSDWNELVDIHAYRMRTESEDFIGSSGAPKLNPGFAIGVNGNNLTISPGRMYVDGILCENEKEVSITEQPDLPGFTLPTEEGLYLAYLEVWHRHITAIEDPALREVNLGGPDTATRVRTVWQVKLLRVGDVGAAVGAESDLPGWTELVAPTTATLRARVQGGASAQLRTSLYRVEVHRVDSSGIYLKWARDNASIVARWLRQDNNRLTIESVDRNAASDFTPGKWVELTDDRRELWTEPGTLVPVTGVEGDVLTIDPEKATDSIQRQYDKHHPKIRRWDSKGEIEVGPGWIELEDGIEVQLTDGAVGPGDYWLIPARSFNRGIDWPGDTPIPPHGIARHYCRLALVERKNGKFQVGKDDGEGKDYRFLFSALNALRAITALDSGDNAPDGTIYVDNDGNVGIGTRSPRTPLQIPFKYNTPNGGLRLYESADDYWDIRNMSHGMAFEYSGVTKLLLQYGGNVGIGTANPGAKLHIVGDIRVDAGSLTAGKKIAGASLEISGHADAGSLTATNKIKGASLEISGHVAAKSLTATNKIKGASLDVGSGSITAGSLTAGTMKAAGHMALMPSGNVGIGGTNPADRLDVAGEVRILSDSNPIRFTRQWSGFPDNKTNGAEISNDTGSFQTLMLVGNKSNDGRTRRVSVWDRLEVNGNVNVTGDLTAARVFTRKVYCETLAWNRVVVSSVSKVTSWVDMPDMGMTIFTKHGGTFTLRFYAGGVRGYGNFFLQHDSVYGEFRILVDDSQKASSTNEFISQGGTLWAGWEQGCEPRDISLEKSLRLDKGPHTIKVQWSVRSPQARAGSGSGWFCWENRCYLSASYNDNTRSLIVLEL